MQHDIGHLERVHVLMHVVSRTDVYDVHKMDMSSLGCSLTASKAGRVIGSSLLFCLLCLNVALMLLLSSGSKRQVQPTENDLYSALCPLFSIPKAPKADTIVIPASEQIIEMHQRRRGVGVKNYCKQTDYI